MRRLHYMKFAGLTAALILGASACATSASDGLDEARATYAQAEQSRAVRYAPTELKQAKITLERAERALKENPDSPGAQTLAYLAMRQSQQAIASAQVNYLATLKKAREDQLLAQTDAARRGYQEQLTQQQQLTEQQLREQRAQLQDAMDQLDDQRAQSGDIEQLRADYQQAMDQLDDEIARRQQAEQRLDEVTDRLAQIADVRDDGQGTVISLNSATLFENGKSELLPAARQNLMQVADTLKLQPDIDLTVAGYTSSTGSEAFNQQLSEDRAASVKDFLVERGIAAERIKTVGYGEDRPIATNDTAEGRAMNRRVEILVQPSAIGGGPTDSQGSQGDQDDSSGQDMQGIEPFDQLENQGIQPGDEFNQPGDRLDSDDHRIRDTEDDWPGLDDEGAPQDEEFPERNDGPTPQQPIDLP